MALGEDGKKAADVLVIDGIEVPRGVRWTVETARREVSHALVRLLEDEEARAVTAHRVGTQLVVFYSHGVDEVLGYASFTRFYVDHLGLEETDAHRALRIAKRATAEEARRYRYSACLRGFTLMDLTKTASLTELAKKQLVTEAGEKVRFPAPVRVLDSCIRHLRPKAVEDDGGATERLAAAAAKLTGRAADVFERYAPLRSLRPRAVVRDGKVLLDLPPLDLAQRRALVKALAELDG